MSHNILHRLLEDKGIPTKWSQPPEFAICCWKCGDKKFHMQVNEEKGVAYCYRRRCTASIKQLCKHFGVVYQKVELPTTSLSSLSEKFTKTIVETEKEDNTTPLVLVDLSTFHRIPCRDSHSSKIGQMARDYMYSRGFNDTIIDQYNLRFSPDGPYMGRIIVPFFNDGAPVYFLARKFMGEGKKVLAPSSNEIPKGAHHWLYNIDQAKKFDEVIICEGWASAISVGPQAIAIQGNVASKVQIDTLLSNWSNFTVVLDSDATKETIKLSKTLLSHINTKVKVAYIPFGDPNDVYKTHPNDLYEIIRNARPFNEMRALKILCLKS